MAEESAQEKTEQASPKRVKDAADKGQIARSRELTTMAMMMASAAAFLFFGERFITDIGDILTRGLSLPREVIFDSSAATRLFLGFIEEALLLLAPLFIAMVFVAFLAPLALGGWNFSIEAMSFKGERMSFLKGMKRFFGPQGLMELLKALAKFLLVGSVLVALLWFGAAIFLQLGSDDISTGMAATGEVLIWSFFALSASLIIVAAVDVPFQLWNHAKQLRMTKQEVKDEGKETNGNPEQKSRLRQLQREFAQRRMMAEIPKADVIVTNPTHFAVALRYDQETMSTPIVVAKGVELIAMQIRQIGDAHKITRVEAPPLARALYYSTEIDRPIPTGLYLAVAQLLAYVYQVKRHGGRRQGVKQPDFPIPDEFRRS